MREPKSLRSDKYSSSPNSHFSTFDSNRTMQRICLASRQKECYKFATQECCPMRADLRLFLSHSQ